MTELARAPAGEGRLPPSEDGVTTRPHRVATRTTSWLLWAIVGSGVAMRLLQYIANRGLSQDEATLALNVIRRSPGQLLHQLDFQQAAPEGFLLVEKALVSTAGSTEYVLRFFPLLAGIVALILVVGAARTVVAEWTAVVAAFLFAFSDPLIGWSVYAKQYEVDVAFAAGLMWLGLRLLDSPRSRYLVALAILGAASTWISHPGVFVLGAILTACATCAVARRDWTFAAGSALAGAATLASFVAFMVTAASNLVLLQNVLRGSPGAFAVSASSSGESFRRGFGEFRYVSGIPHFLSFSHVDVGLLLFGVVVAFCALGTVSLIRTNVFKAIVVVAPIAFMFVAWGLNKYPLLGRTQLFLLPSFVVVVAQGIMVAVRFRRAIGARAVACALGAAVAVATAAPALGHVVHPRSLEDIKPLLAEVARHQQPTDTIYVFYSAQYQLRYYLECGCAGATFERARSRKLWPFHAAAGGPDAFAPALLSVPPRLVVAQFRGRDPGAYRASVRKLAGRRVWVLVSAIDDDDRRLLIRDFGRRWLERLAFSTGKGADGAAVYLVARSDA